MKFTPVPLRMILAVMVTYLLPVVPETHAQQATEGFSVAPGVLVDPTNGVAYLMSPEHQVEAVSLKDGKIIWSSSDASKPIAVRANRIIAQVESDEATSKLTLVALDARDGEPQGSEAIDLGDGVISSIDDGKEHQFQIGTEISDSTKGEILWRYYQQKVSGPDAGLAPVFERFGALHVNEVASVEIIPGGGFPRESGQPPYSGSRVSRPLSEKTASDTIILDLDSGLRYRLDGIQVPTGSDAISSNPASVSASAKTTTFVPPTSGLIITEGRPGEEFPPTRRIPGDQFSYSADGHYLVASEFAAKIEAAEPYRWTIYTRGIYEVVARFMAQTSMTSFVLSKDRVIYMRQPFQRREDGKLQSYPLALIARDTQSGRIVWTHPVRETHYKGFVPE